MRIAGVILKGGRVYSCLIAFVKTPTEVMIQPLFVPTKPATIKSKIGLVQYCPDRG